MLEKIKNFWANPYYAPLTEPLGNVVRTVEKSVSGYTEAIKEAFNDKCLWERDRSRMSRIYSNIVGNGGFGMMNGIGMMIGGAVTGIAGGAFAWTGMAASGIAAKLGVAAVAGIAAATVGGLATPFVLAAGIAAGAVVVGAVIGVVPGLIGGTIKAYKHHHALKNPPPAPVAAPAAASPSAQQVQNETRARMMRDFGSLDIYNKRSMILELERMASLTPQEKVMTAINTLSETQRVALLEEMEQKIGTAFDTVARKKAVGVGVLVEDISVQSIPAKLKRRNAPAPEGGAAG